MYFLMEKRPKLREEYATATVGDLAKMLGAAWCIMSHDQNAPYEEMTGKDTVKRCKPWCGLNKKKKVTTQTRPCSAVVILALDQSSFLFVFISQSYCLYLILYASILYSLRITPIIRWIVHVSLTQCESRYTRDFVCILFLRNSKLWSILVLYTSEILGGVGKALSPRFPFREAIPSVPLAALFLGDTSAPSTTDEGWGWIFVLI